MRDQELEVEVLAFSQYGVNQFALQLDTGVGQRIAAI
jgi:hypothetical protein